MGEIELTVEINKINESYIRIGCGQDLALDLSEKFSFYTENYRWSPKYKSGVWDGKIRLFQMKGRLLPIGLYDDLLIYFKQNNIKFEDKVENTFGPNLSAKFIKRFCNDLLKCPYELRDYQISSIQQALKYKKLILLSATGSGKSLILFMIINLLKYMDDSFKTLLVVPTTSLVHQMCDDFIEYGKNFCDYEKYIHIIYSGKEKKTDKPLIISTWQSLMRMPASYFTQYDSIFIDETHTAAATELSKMVNNSINAQFKIGTTGSLKECTTSKMQLRSLFSKVFRASSTKNLQKKKILAPLEIRNCILDYPEKYRKLCRKLNYKEECDLIKSIEIRKKFICNIVKKAKGNSLVLFRSVQYGKEIYEMLKKENMGTYLIYGETKVDDREKARKIAEEQDNVIIVASMGVFSTGINIKRLHNLFFIESTKSLIRVIQSIGRALRTHESKKTAILYDLVDDLQYKRRKNYVLKHFFSRIKIYDNQEFSYKTRSFKLG